MNETFPTWLLAISILSIVIIIASSLSSLAFLYYYRNMPIVAMGQPHMLAMICFGVLMIAASLFISQVIVPSKSTAQWSVLCHLDIWFYYIGYVSILTTMFCMLYRVQKVMRIRRGQTILPRHVLGPFVAAQLVIFGLLVWYEFAFSQAVTIHNGIAYCYTLNSEMNNAWIVPVVKQVFVILLSISVIGFAWKVRHVSEEIGCSRKVFLLCCFIVIEHAVELAIVFPVVDAEGIEDTKKYYIVFITSMLADFLAIAATFGFLILPRMYYVWYERIHGHLPESVTMIGTGRVHVRDWAPTAPKCATTKPTLPGSGKQREEDDTEKADARSEVAEA